MKLSLATVLLVSLLLQATSGQNYCHWDKDKDFPDPQPFLMDPATTRPLYPQKSGSKRVVTLALGSSVLVTCTGNGNTISILGTQSANAKCLGGQLLDIAGQKLLLSQLACSKKHSSEANHVGTCEGNSKDILILFIIHPLGYYSTVNPCFEPNLETPLYSSNVVSGSYIGAKDLGGNRPSFKADSYFTLPMDEIYQTSTQETTFATILKSPQLAKKYIDFGKHSYLAKGHLTPDANFVLRQEQFSTYYYINAAPQWQDFNNGFWKRLENGVVKLAVCHGTDLSIRTGTYGILQLPDVNNQPQDIYLGMAKNQRKVPVPEIFWKVVYESTSNRAVAFVGVNNVFLSTAPPHLCTDICSQLSWINCVTKSIPRGYMYACEVNDLRQRIPYVPNLGQVGILDS